MSFGEFATTSPSALPTAVAANGSTASLFDSPFVRIADLARLLGVTYPAAKADIDRLVSAKILQELPGATSKTFYAEEVFRSAYADA